METVSTPAGPEPVTTLDPPTEEDIAEVPSPATGMSPLAHAVSLYVFWVSGVFKVSILSLKYFCEISLFHKEKKEKKTGLYFFFKSRKKTSKLSIKMIFVH